MADSDSGLHTVEVQDLDKVFEIALVLLGILAAAEFQYATALPLSNDVAKLQQFTFRVTTLPFVVLIMGWIINELYIKVKRKQQLEYFLKFFCWNLWSFTLFVFLILLIPFCFIGIKMDVLQDAMVYLFLAWGLVFVLIYIIKWGYGNLYSKQDNAFLNKTKWYNRIWIIGFVIAFFGFFLPIALWGLAAFG